MNGPTSYPLRKRDSLILLALNVLIAGYFAGAHVICSYSTDWVKFFNLSGDFPFQLRVLPFFLGKFIFQLLSIEISQTTIKVFFVLTDFLGCLVAIGFIASILRHQQKVMLTFVAFWLFWRQMYFTFIISVHLNVYYPSDVLSIAFICIGLYLAEQRNWRLLLLIIPLATLNRETAVLLAGFYFIRTWLEGPRKATFVSITLAIIWPVTKLAISWLLNAPAGGLVSLYTEYGRLRFFYNFAFLKPRRFYEFFTINCVAAFGFTWVLFLLKDYRFNLFQPYLYLFPLFLLGMVFVGNLSEIRIFGEFIPIVSLALAVGLGVTFSSSDQNPNEKAVRSANIFASERQNMGIAFSNINGGYALLPKTDCPTG
jgi:hypothetical protein